MKETYPFQLKPLPYDYEALSPEIGAETVRIHHDKHLQTYVDNLNKALSQEPELQGLTLKELILKVPKLEEPLKTAVRNNAGGVFHHNFYFDGMTGMENKPKGDLKDAIDRDFGGTEAMLAELKKAALGQFGSGWAWLVLNPDGKLHIMSTANQDSPFPFRVCPILAVDVWEHAYYLDYQNRRADYVDQWMKLINWEKAEEHYQRALFHFSDCLHS